MIVVLDRVQGIVDMTKLLKQAFKKASELPSDLQDELAHELLQDMQAEQKWDEALVESQDVLDSLARDALKQHKTGHTKQMGPDEL
jgi:hypothetical protein